MVLTKLLFLIVIATATGLERKSTLKEANVQIRSSKNISKRTQRFMIPTVQPGVKINQDLTPEAITITKKSNSLKDTELPGAFGSDPELRDSFEGTGSGSGVSEEAKINLTEETKATATEETKATATEETKATATEETKVTAIEETKATTAEEGKTASTEDVKTTSTEEVSESPLPSKELSDHNTDAEGESKKQIHDEVLTRQDIVAETASNFGSNIPIVPGINPTSAFISNENRGDGGEGSDYGIRVNHKHKYARKSSLHHNKEKNDQKLHHNKKFTTSQNVNASKPENSFVSQENKTAVQKPAKTTTERPTSTTKNVDETQTTASASKKTELNEPENDDEDDDASINESEDYRIKNKLSVSRDDDDNEEKNEDQKIIENIKPKKYKDHSKHSSKHVVKYVADNTDDDDDDMMASTNVTIPTDKSSTNLGKSNEVVDSHNKTLSPTLRMQWNSTRTRPKNAYITAKSSRIEYGGTDLYNTIQRIQDQIKQVETEAAFQRKKVNKTESRKDKKLRKEVNSVMKKIEDDLIKYRQKTKTKSYRYYNDKNAKQVKTVPLNTSKEHSNQENIPFDPYEDTKAMEEAYTYYLNRSQEEQKKKPSKNFIYSKTRGESSDATKLPSELTNSSVDTFPKGIAGGPEGFECPWPCLWTCHSYCPKECCNNPYRCKPICREFCTPYCTDKCCAPGSRRLPKLKLQFQSPAETGYNVAKLKKEKTEIENKIKVIEKAQEYASQLFGLPATCPLFCNRICAPALCKSECCRPLVNTIASLLEPINKKISELQESKPIVSDPVPANRINAQIAPTPAPHADNVMPVEKASSSLTPHYALEELQLKKVSTPLQPPTKKISVIDVPYYADKKQIAETLQLTATSPEASSIDTNILSAQPQYVPLRKSVPPILNRLRTDEELLRKALETSPYSSNTAQVAQAQAAPAQAPSPQVSSPQVAQFQAAPAQVSPAQLQSQTLKGGDAAVISAPAVPDTSLQLQAQQSNVLEAQASAIPEQVSDMQPVQASALPPVPPSVNSFSIPNSLQSMEPISHLTPETKAFYSSVYSPTETSESPLNAEYCPPICRTSCIEQCPNECCPNGGRQRSSIEQKK